MNLSNKFWKKLSKKPIDYGHFFSVFFYITLSIGCIWIIFAFWNIPIEEILQELMESSEKSTGRRKRNDTLYITFLKNFGKEGVFIFLIIALYLLVTEIFSIIKGKKENKDTID